MCGPNAEVVNYAVWNRGYTGPTGQNVFFFGMFATRAEAEAWRDTNCPDYTVSPVYSPEGLQEQ